jgi:hypothetical protein
MEFFEKIYVNDLDGNLFLTNTPIYIHDNLENKEIILTPQEFDKQRELYTNNNRYSFPNNCPETAFQHFRDYFSDSRHRWPDWFIEDVTEVLENKAFAPSFPKFVDEVLVKGRLFAVLTARWHSPDNLCRWFKMINNTFLNDQQKEEQIENIKNNYWLVHLSDQQAITSYFEDIAYYIPISNKERCKNRWIDRNIPSREKKALGMDRYLQQMSHLIEKIKKQSLHEILWYDDKKISVWFSDDMPENILSMIHAFMQWWDENKFTWYQFRAYYTGDMSQIEKMNMLLDKTRLQIETPDDAIVKYII